MNKQIVIFIVFILTVTVHSKSIFSKSTKDQYNLSQTTYSSQTSKNDLQIAPTSQFLNSSPLEYLKQSIPRKILNCMSQFNILRCMKIYILQNLETSNNNDNMAKNTSVTADFFNRIVCDTNSDDHSSNDFYYKLSDKELNKRIYLGFKQFFGDREIKIQLTPGLIINVVSSQNDLLDVSLKKQLMYKPSTDGILSGRGKKNKYFQYFMKMGVPAMFLPVALLGSFLPMILPGIKMATLFTGAINNAALVAALMYLARMAALENEQKNTVYYTAGSMH